MPPATFFHGDGGIKIAQKKLKVILKQHNLPHIEGLLNFRQQNSNFIK